MPGPFRWISDTSRGDWLAPMRAERLGNLAAIVPRGFEAYARIFHPVLRDRPRRTGSWLGVDGATYFAGARDIGALLETESCTWEQTAESFGTTMHAGAQYARLVRSGVGASGSVVAQDGWRYLGPLTGSLAAPSYAALSTVLARHTASPRAGIAAVWSGWGGLTSAAGYVLLTPGAVDQRNRDHAGTDRRIDEPPGREADPGPGSGLLSQEIATGSTLEILPGTGREYVLFEAGARDFADPAWPGRAPWVQEPLWAQSPAMLWPEDHAWLLATEIDFDSTLVGGSSALIRSLLATSGLEVHAITLAADLSWDGDQPNRPV